MNRIQEQFSSRMDVISFNTDNESVTQTRHAYGLRNRSQYVLIDQNQNIIKSWFGRLDQDSMLAELDQLLVGLGY